MRGSSRLSGRSLIELRRQRGDAEPARTDQASTSGLTYLPRAGEPGPRALRSWLPFAVPPHAATSATLAGAYPFLAEAGFGSGGVVLRGRPPSWGGFRLDPSAF